MIKNIFVVFAAFLICNTLAQQRNNNAVDIKEEINGSRKSNSILSEIAYEFFRRSSSSSQILNLNLSNLLLFLVLKAVVYGAGYIGGHTFKGRGNVEDKLLSEGETALALGYLIGDTCLYRTACEVPNTAKEYLGAADFLYKTIKLMPQLIPIDDSYGNIMTEFQNAIDLGLRGQCPSKYNCKKENIHRFLRP